MALVRIDALALRRPDALSGGQQQRVALARALVMRPRVLLLDEPLAALDLKLRKQMQEELRRIHQSIGGTFVFVTHDQGEAMGLANRIAVMEDGACVQEGGPEEIYARPSTRFVSTFIGDANVLQGERRGGTVSLRNGLKVASAGADGPVVAVLRPEAVTVAHAGAGLAVTVAGTLADAVFLGAYVRYRVALADGEEIVAHAAGGREGAPRPGEAVVAGWAADALRILDDR
jgi:ABC-type Fe3+/spermidine/putrescine transport system ATPase subunit